MQIRRANLADLEGIIRLTKPYFDESVYSKHVTYSESNTRDAFARLIVRSNTFVIDIDGELIAIGAVTIDKTFYEEKEADLDFFFIKKEHRGSGAGRLLAEACVKFAELSDARVMYACGGSGIEGNNDKLWVNLWKKHGFEFLGTTMIKVN